MIPGMKAPEPRRVNRFRMVLERRGPMRLEVDVFASEKIPVEAGALDQLADAACLPGAVRVLATPDLHVGYGVPIGAVVAAEDFISPAAVGYDINCGMRLITTPWSAKEVDVRSLARAVRGVIPLGEGKSNVRLSAKGLERVLKAGSRGLLECLEQRMLHLPDPAVLSEVCLEEERHSCLHVERQGALQGDPSSVTDRAKERGLPQIGTLGGGNHFIELQQIHKVVDEQCATDWGVFLGQLVVMIHSGSRGLGHEIGGHYMKVAKRLCREKRIEVPNDNLCILPLASEEGRRYLGAMNAAANYAFANRQMMSMLVKAAIRSQMGPAELPTVYDVAHNLASPEIHQGQQWMIHRKGATRAFPPEAMKGTPFEKHGQPVLVPGSMGTASWLLRGITEGQATLYSTNHGAGRVMSRKAAAGRRRGRRGKVFEAGAISEREFEQSMSAVYLLCEDRRSIREEAPAAYKDIDAVIETVVGTGMAAPVARMIPLAVLKG